MDMIILWCGLDPRGWIQGRKDQADCILRFDSILRST
jgi:hypothetical protein